MRRVLDFQSLGVCIGFMFGVGIYDSGSVQ